MSAINFPDPSQSPWTNSSTGITYTYSNGVWKALSSEETFLKPADADLAYLKKNDGGTQQVISGGGGLNVDGDVQKKGNTVPSAVMGASAPSNPGICDFWTDTSGDTPVLKSWNGTEWVEVGSSGASEFAPVISNVTLTENDTTGDRFTSQTFDVDITMLREGEPFSQKGLKGEVTAEFSVYPSTESIASNAVTTFPNNNQSYNSVNYTNNGGAKVYATDPTGKGVWYFIRGVSSNQNQFWINADPGTPSQSYAWGTSDHTNSYSAGWIEAATYFESPDENYIFAHSHRGDCSSVMPSWRRPTDGSGPWEGFNNGGHNMSVPFWDSEHQVWWTFRMSGNSLQYCKGNAMGSVSLGEKWISSNTSQSSGMYAVGPDRIVVSRRNSNSGTVRTNVFARNSDSGIQELGGSTALDNNNSQAEYLKYLNGMYWMNVDGNLYKSSDGYNWYSGGTISTDSDYYNIGLEYNPESGKIEAYGYRYGSRKLQVHTTNNNGATWVLAHDTSYTDGQRPNLVFVAGNKLIWWGYDNNKFHEYSYPYNEQTVTLSGTAGDYADFNVGDSIRPAGSSISSERGSIASISGTSIAVKSDYVYQTGDVIEAVHPTGTSVSSRYLVIDATGSVTSTVGSDPGYVSIGPNTSKTLTFPATFDTGNAPDAELPAGTTFKVSAQATNSIGSSEFGPSNVITPA